MSVCVYVLDFFSIKYPLIVVLHVSTSFKGGCGSAELIAPIIYRWTNRLDRRMKNNR